MGNVILKQHNFTDNKFELFFLNHFCKPIIISCKLILCKLRSRNKLQEMISLDGYNNYTYYSHSGDYTHPGFDSKRVNFVMD